jgi:ERCC4-type nuclease
MRNVATIKHAWPEGLIIAVDTREQAPWRFPQSQRVTLATGDYSVVGLEDRITIERKSLADAYGSIGRGRSRFQREWERMAEFDYAACVIEASLAEFLAGPERTLVHPSAAMGTLSAWSVRYGVHVMFAGGRRFAAAWTGRVLRQFWVACQAEEGRRRLVRPPRECRQQAPNVAANGGACCGRP